VSRGAHHETEAVVLRVRPFGETSQVVHLATPEHGLVAALGKGACRPGPELQGGMTLGAVGRARLVRRRGAELEILARFRLQEDLRGLRDDMARFRGACHVLALLRAWMQPALPAPALFRAARTALRALAGAPRESVAAWIAWFEARALAATGHRPRLEACAVCDRPLRPGAAVPFSPEAGGCVHPDCAPPGAVHALDAAAHRALVRLYTARLPELRRSPPDAAAVRGARAVHDAFLPWVLERRPASLDGLPGRRRPRVG
jgi:DNA repair protein RecO (recombination protein O)